MTTDHPFGGPRHRLFSTLSAAMGIAIGAVFNRFGDAPTIHKGKHRVAAESEQGRRFVSRTYRRARGGLFAHLSNNGGGEREVARRQRQIAANKLHPLYRHGAQAA